MKIKEMLEIYTRDKDGKFTEAQLAAQPAHRLRASSEYYKRLKSELEQTITSPSAKQTV